MPPDRYHKEPKRALESNALIDFIDPDLELDATPRNFIDVDKSRIQAYAMSIPETAVSIVARKVGGTWRVKLLPGDLDAAIGEDRLLFIKTIREIGEPTWEETYTSDAIRGQIRLMVENAQREDLRPYLP